MKNRAKCRLCKSVLDFLDGDYLVCNCGEVTLDGIHKKVVCIKSIDNFCEIDDHGNEIVTDANITTAEPSAKPNRKELIGMLDEMIKNVESLPQNAMLSPITHYDYVSLMILLASIFKSDLSSEDPQSGS